MEPKDLPDPGPEAREAPWLLFFVVLLAPAVMSMLAAASRQGDLVIGCVFFGSGAAALICGFLVTQRQRNLALRILLALSLAVVLYFVSVALCFAGCAMGNR